MFLTFSFIKKKASSKKEESRREKKIKNKNIIRKNPNKKRDLKDLRGFLYIVIFVLIEKRFHLAPFRT